MEKKLFDTLYSVDVSKFTEKKQNLTYLSWAYAWREFKTRCPDAQYTVFKDGENRPYFGDDDIGHMVYTTVTANGETHEMWLPVMDNNNKAMKKEPYTYKTLKGERTVEAMSMFDVNKTIMRCLAKNLAMFGLGLYIYAGEDLPADVTVYVCSECGAEISKDIAERTNKAFGSCLCKTCGIKRSEAQKNVK